MGRNTSSGAVTHGGIAQHGDEPDASQECGDTILHGHRGETPLCLIPASSPSGGHISRQAVLLKPQRKPSEHKVRRRRGDVSSHVQPSTKTQPPAGWNGVAVGSHP